MDGQNIGKYLIIAGAIILLLGVILYFSNLRTDWLGKLPGDFQFDSKNVKIYFPIATMIVISVVINLIIWLIRRYF